MGRAAVTLSEVDLSTRVPAFPGVYGAIAVPSKKGDVDAPQLVTSYTDFLKRYTPDEKLEVGDDGALWSALTYLQKSNKLWVMRAHNVALYGGVVIKDESATGANAAIITGQSAPTSYLFDNTSGDGDAVLIYGANPGVWNNKIYIKIVNYVADSNGVATGEVKESGAFIIKVYKSTDLNNEVEKWIVSLNSAHLDGFNKNIFVESVLKSSIYIRAYVNPATASTLPKSQSSTLQFATGSDGGTVADSHMITALNTMANSAAYPVTVFMDGGLATAAYQTALITLVEARKDCVAVMSTPFASEDAASYLNDIKTYRQTTLNANSSYAALYSPHIKIYDSFNDREVYVPPDGFVAGAMSETASNYELWYPIAGFKRGNLNVLDLRRRFTDGEMDSLSDIGVNPNWFSSGKGIFIWGQKTLSTRPSSLDRLNVRLLLIYIQPAIKTALEDFLFDLNDIAARNQVRSIIESYMDGIAARKGVTDYDVICDSSNNSAEDMDNHILNVWLFVKPTQSIESIKLKTVITRTGVSFESAAASV